MMEPIFLSGREAASYTWNTDQGNVIVRGVKSALNFVKSVFNHFSVSLQQGKKYIHRPETKDTYARPILEWRIKEIDKKQSSSLPNRETSQSTLSPTAFLQSNDYEIVDVKGDGNCFYNSLVLGRQDWDPIKLRKEMFICASEWCKKNEDKYYHKQLDSFSKMLYVHLEIEGGLKAIETKDSWGDAIVSIFAAKVLNEPIVVITERDDIGFSYDDKGECMKIRYFSELKDCIIIQHGKNHFKRIRPKRSTAQ